MASEVSTTAAFLTTTGKYSLTLLDHILFFVLLGFLAFVWAFVIYSPRERPWIYASSYGRIPALIACVSLAATCLPPLISLGIMNEVFTNGPIIWYHGFGYLVAIIFTAHLYVPIYYNSRQRTSFQYVECRFGEYVRALVTLIIVLQYLCFLPFVLITPAIIFKHVISGPLWIAYVVILLLALAPTFFNSTKAVSCNDFLTFIITFIILICLIILRKQEVGGLMEVWRTIPNQLFPNIEPDPFETHGLWALLIGGSTTWCCFMCYNPLVINRCMAIESLTKSKIALWVSFVFGAIMSSAVVICGLICYSTYYQCNPLTRFNNFHVEELISYWMMSVNEGDYLPGLFVSSILASSIGYVSCGVEIISLVSVNEAMEPLTTIRFRTVKLMYNGFRIAYGALIISAILFADYFKNMFMTSLQMFTAFGGPLLGIFSLGIFIPWANSKGAIAGCLCGLIISFWKTIGHMIYFPDVNISVPLNTSECPKLDIINNMTIFYPETQLPPIYDGILSNFYRMSYLWTAPISTGTVILFGFFVSIITGGQDLAALDLRLLWSLPAYCIKKCSREHSFIRMSSSSQFQEAVLQRTIISPGQSSEVREVIVRETQGRLQDAIEATTSKIKTVTLPIDDAMVVENLESSHM